MYRRRQSSISVFHLSRQFLPCQTEYFSNEDAIRKEKNNFEKCIEGDKAAYPCPTFQENFSLVRLSDFRKIMQLERKKIISKIVSKATKQHIRVPPLKTISPLSD